MTSNDKVWKKVLKEAEKGAYTHVFYVWEQLEHITKKIILAKGNYPKLQSKIIATNQDPFYFQKLVSDFNKNPK